MISGHHFGRSRGGRQSGGAAERARRPGGVLGELGELDGPGGEEDCDCEVASEVGAVFEEDWFDVRGRGSGAGAGPRSVFFEFWLILTILTDLIHVLTRIWRVV